ncbi:MAG: hypothetical protein ACYS9X_24385 [Planctomycetota bacterium]
MPRGADSLSCQGRTWDEADDPDGEIKLAASRVESLSRLGSRTAGWEEIAKLSPWAQVARRLLGADSVDLRLNDFCIAFGRNTITERSR